MAHLYQRFLQSVEEVEGADASNFRRFRLKERLKKSYPQLVFHTPRFRNHSEFVYAENLSAEDLMDEHMASNQCHDVVDDGNDGDSDDEFENEIECKEDNVISANSRSLPSVNEVQLLYHASMVIKSKIDKPPLNTPWPALATDITDENVKKVVDPALFTFLAWICGFSKDPKLDTYVDVKDAHYCRLMALQQDLVFIASDGKKATPKSISLAMALRQLTGSSTVLKVVNTSGHCMSHRYVLRHETALAQVNSSSQGALPPGFTKNESTILVWDNDDFCEETRTGKGTTHITGGIIIQRHCSDVQKTQQVRKHLERSSSIELTPDGRK